ncbi:MAG: FecR domain-containing protein [Myxococcota bacterium]
MMLDPDRLRALTTPDWTAQREDAVLRRLQQAERPRAVRWIAISAVTMAAAALILVWWSGVWRSGGDAAVPVLSLDPSPDGPIVDARPQVADPLQSSPSTPPRTAPVVTPLQFRDGSAVIPDDEGSDLVIAEAGADLTRVELRRGGARFDVTPRLDRQFRVEMGLVTVDVLGTEFHCLRQDGRVTVEVIRGRVSVSWPGGSSLLRRGESGVFPPVAAEPSPERRAPASSSGARWRRLARKGEATAAYEALRAGEAVANRAEELMLAADVARKAGHPAAALPYLRRVVEEHPADSRAPLAAFTIGRIEFGRGRYRKAAKHFARVREMGETSLVEHALAREVEAWAAAGDEARAQRLARDYVSRYPQGPRVDKVHRVLVAGDH